MKTFRILAICFAAFGLYSCASDDNPPAFGDFRVNGTVISVNSGPHDAGTTIDFSFDVTDNEALDSYTIKNESNGSELLADGQLEGTSQNIGFAFAVPDTAVSGSNILLTFIAIDNDGLSAFREYTVNVP
ncbi:MAG: hypothetical protein AAFV80_15240 [Bacteroidota bacterium]